MLRLPRARPQTRPDARTRNLSKPLLTQELDTCNLYKHFSDKLFDVPYKKPCSTCNEEPQTACMAREPIQTQSPRNSKSTFRKCNKKFKRKLCEMKRGILMKTVELCPRCPSAKPTPPASHGLILDEDRGAIQ